MASLAIKDVIFKDVASFMVIIPDPFDALLHVRDKVPIVKVSSDMDNNPDWTVLEWH